MRLGRSNLIFIIILLFLANCNEQSSITFFHKSDIDQELFQKLLKETIDSLYIDKLPSLKANLPLIKSFYQNRNFASIFFGELKFYSELDSVLHFFAKANEHGLNPESYHYSELLKRKKFINDTTLSINERHKFLVETKILLCDGLLNYSSHLKKGIFSPKVLYPDFYFFPTNDFNTPLEPLQQENILEYLKQIQPRSKRYKDLQVYLKKMESLKELKLSKLPFPKTKIKVNDRYDHLSEIIKRLSLFEILDTNSVKVYDNVYDSNLVPYIKKFQRSFGLIDDGVIGKNTIEKLNLIPNQIIDLIKINLERIRWFNYEDTSRYVLVNIPDFNVYLIENGEKKLKMKVCVGMKGEWETPVLYSRIDHIVLNPTWNVPQTIIQEEIIQELKKDSLYLKKKRFRVFLGKKEIELSDKDFNKLSAKRYTLIQDPGEMNALGKIKIIFDNPFGVYLHDTPYRAPFSYEKRTVSHGCIRLESPLKLVEEILKDNSEWNIDFVKIEIGYKVKNRHILDDYLKKRDSLINGNRTTNKSVKIKLNNQIPIFIDYLTAWVDDEGILNLRDDVYQKDKILFELFLKNINN